MPEATVNEHGDPFPGEDDVRSHTTFRQVDPQIAAVAVASPVQS